ncbi:hypothetical protein BASA60_010241 [Batrachochytrium salamandrivorans]|nr:hypothetical protein BASA60_010241 [Batrachochytrium salamandrivorans]
MPPSTNMSINSHTQILCRASASFFSSIHLHTFKQHSLVDLSIHHAILYLLSFVAVVSHAAALPQPAGLFEKYSNDVDTNSASGLEARSYQPGLNSHKDSATLVSLKRRDDSDGSSGENSGSDSFLPSTSGPNEPFKSPFTDSNVSSMNLASTIDNVGDGVLNLYKDGEKG